MKSVDRLMKEAVEKGVFPGAVLLVWAEGEVRFHHAYGVADLFSGNPATLETVYDLASLTKPLATTLSVMLLLEKGRLELDAPLCKALPLLESTDKGRLTVRQLLTHQAGFAPWRPYFHRIKQEPPGGRMAALRKLLIAEPLQYAPATQTLYSDVGFMLLHWVVEAAAGQELDRFLAESVCRPLGLEKSLFYPGISENRPDVAYGATELCPLRGRLLIGEVHDDNAHAGGGVAGHAGLFGTAAAVGTLLAELLEAFRGRSRHFPQELVRQFWAHSGNGDRCLGFDVPDRTSPSCGRYFSSRSIGHLGFTGTSFWIDPERPVFVVLLSNRVHPSRHNIAIRSFRPVLHDEIMKQM